MKSATITQMNIVVRFMTPWGEEKELSFRVRHDQIKIEKAMEEAADRAIAEWIVLNNPLVKKLQS